MKRFIISISVATLFLFATSVSAGVITGSAHDFQNLTSWNSTGEICIVCHAAHNNNNLATELLWNHAMTVATYTVYSSPTFSQVAANPPSGASKLCLSCHDGTVALDSFGGNGTSPGTIIGGDANFGTDLSNDHPISFPYTVGVGEELNATTANVDFGDGTTGTVADLLFDSDVECSSCHDVHNSKAFPGSKLLLVDNDGSKLCLTCHAK